MFTSGILLAAGSASRMGTDKLELPYKGRRVIDHALAPFVESSLIDELIVVVRPGFQLQVNEPKCRVVVNADHQEGLGSSLRAGVTAAKAAADAFVVSLADMPELSVEIIAALIEAFGRGGKRILVPVCQRRHGHPVIFAGACRGDLLQLGGDLGARTMIQEHPEMVQYFPTQHRAVVYDLDTPVDLQLKRMVFDDADAFRHATAALEGAGVYFEAAAPADDVGAEPAAIGYYAFDEEQVAALCRGGNPSES